MSNEYLPQFDMRATHTPQYEVKPPSNSEIALSIMMLEEKVEMLGELLKANRTLLADYIGFPKEDEPKKNRVSSLTATYPLRIENAAYVVDDVIRDLMWINDRLR